mgnify:CR=1 FL=1
MAQTMEQKRAADAWARSQGCSKAYQNLAKTAVNQVSDRCMHHTVCRGLL